VQFIRELNRALEIEPVAYECRRCHNRCVFCFIDQMPPACVIVSM
jgi:NifB/MoaA-like Fe-S oxidoreductase